MSNKFSRQHYEIVAKILSNYAYKGFGYMSEQTETRINTTEDIIEDFITVFKVDNANFDEIRFMKACGFGKK